MDPCLESLILNSLGLIWSYVFITVVLIFSSYFSVQSLSLLQNLFYLSSWSNSLNRFSSLFLFVSSNFFFLFLSNVLGLLPYSFGCTSHFTFNFVLSLIFWASVLVSGMLFNSIYFLAHHTPVGCPLSLSFFLNFVELISNFIRSFTLALRLSVNISTGHILLFFLSSLILSFVLSGSLVLYLFSVLLFSVFVFYLSFEIFVSFIQSFVFNLLVTQYLNDS